jgi:pimeloyl-ACP methyl ester carboxylesterase
MSSVLPVSAITIISDWLAAQVSSTMVELTPPPLHPQLELGKAVERIRWLGPNGLFAIECRPRDAGPDVPVVLLHSGAAEHRVGAGDYQVELARLLAGDGAASVRADRRSTGETGTVRPEDPSLFYSEEWMADQDAIIAALSIRGDRLALTGLCAGGWLAGQRTLENPRLIVDIHPLEYRINPAPAGEYVDEITTEADPMPGKGALREWYRRSAPVWLRQLRDRWKGRAGAGPFLASTAQRADHTVLIFSDLEKMIFDRRGGPRAVARFGGIEAIEVGGSDHALYARPTRQRVIAEVRRQVAQAFDLGTAEPSHLEPRTHTQ